MKRVWKGHGAGRAQKFIYSFVHLFDADSFYTGKVIKHTETYTRICADIEITKHHYHRLQKRSSADHDDDDDALVMGSSSTIAATVGSNRIFECEIRYPSETKVYIEHIITWRKKGTEVPAYW